MTPIAAPIGPRASRRPLKIAVAGKGGAGKTTLAAALALVQARAGRHVLALDADPDANLASALGLPAETRAQIVPIAQRKALIEERTGAKVKQYGQMFKINPMVSDIAQECAVFHAGVALLVLGAIEAGGSGCACPESVLIQALVADLVLEKNEALVMDLEAGVEHLGRSTARGVDVMLVVVEPSRLSTESAERVLRMAADIGLADMQVVANKVTSPDEERWIQEALPGRKIAAVIPFLPGIPSADRAGRSVLDGLDAGALDCLENLLGTLQRG